MKTHILAGAVLFGLTLSACAGGGPDEPNEPVTKDDYSSAIQVYLTGYSYWDNTPPGSAAIARPVIHDRAGGIGTYDDPITLAVGWSKVGWKITTKFPVGERFYFPEIRKYAIVEDFCGDGDNPQGGPCWTGKNGYPWVDIYVDGSQLPRAVSDQCMYDITGMQPAIVTPPKGLPVNPGPLTESGCQTF